MCKGRKYITTTTIKDLHVRKTNCHSRVCVCVCVFHIYICFQVYERKEMINTEQKRKEEKKMNS
jgi:hypothetical protein